MFDLVPNSVAALSLITRGLPRSRRIGELTLRSAVRVALTHFRGLPERWLDLDREVGDAIVRRMRDERPDYLFAAFTGVDKASHARGHDDALVRKALVIVDDVVLRLREDAERGGWWDDTHLWVVSDHGHASVGRHEDLVKVVRAAGYRPMSHPFTAGVARDVAVMVSGNAMAHLYVDLESRRRPWWGALAARWEGLAESVLARPSCDLLLLPRSPHCCEVRSRDRGIATVSRDGTVYRYERTTGDPLAIGHDLEGTADETYDRLRMSSYPDALVQIVALAGSARAGDLILSATPGWDFRARWEPIPHRSSHGSLHRDHMLVPLLSNRSFAGTPRRTTDLFSSTLDAVSSSSGPDSDGASFVQRSRS